MIGIICESGYENFAWTKQQYDNLVSEFRRRRIKYTVIEDLQEACEHENSGETIIVVALGSSKPWFKDIVERCNMMGLRVITVGNYYPRTAEGNFSCVLSDMRNSAIDIYKYFSAYNKNKVILYGVNPSSDFDSELEREMQKLFGVDGVKIIRKSSNNKEEIIENFFNYYESYNGVVCTNDYDAIELLQEIKKRNPNYLKESFIVSFSNTLLSLLYSPSITTFYESATSSAKYTVKLYYMLLQNNDLNNVNFYVKEKLKIRETTHYSPFVSEKAFNVSNVVDCNYHMPHEENHYEERSETVNELRRIEDTLFSFDKIDFSILFLLFEKKSTLEIANILYVSRGSVRYRLSRMLEKFGVAHREDMINLVSRYLAPEALLKYSQEYLDAE